MSKSKKAKEVQPQSGQGKFYWSEDCIYDGEWMEMKRTVDGEEKLVKLKHGKGKYIHGSVSYEGQFCEDMMHGEGEIRFASGSSYSGSFLNDKFEGVGKYVWHTGAFYEGEWKDNKMHGNGVFTAPDGTQFSGVYVGGMGEGVDQVLLD